MKNAKTKSTIFFVLLILISSACYLVLNSDKKGPVITFSNSEFEYKDSMNENDLLKDVLAVDDKDGDVTDRVVVVDVKKFEYEKNKVVITYVAQDKVHNITKVERIVSGTIKEEQPKKPEATKQPEVSKEPEATQKPEATKEPEATMKPEMTEEPEATKEPEMTEEPEEEGPIMSEETAVQLAQSEGCPIIVLKRNKATIKVGSKFNLLREIALVVDESGSSNELWRRIHVDGAYDVNTPGEYNLVIYTVTKSGLHSNEENFTLQVTE